MTSPEPDRPTRTVPPPHTPEELRDAASLTEPVTNRFPAQISVYCDTCYDTVTHDYIVTEEMSRTERWELARVHLRKHGWMCDEFGDWCPDHAESC